MGGVTSTLKGGKPKKEKKEKGGKKKGSASAAAGAGPSSSPPAAAASTPPASGGGAAVAPPVPKAPQPPEVSEAPSNASAGDGEAKYGRPDKLGLNRIDFINIHRKDYTGRIELLQGSVEGLAKSDETDLLMIYLKGRGKYKGNRDSSLAALNRAGFDLAQLEKESKPQPSYRRHYHCWLSRLIPKTKPVGFEYKRLLVYEDPGDELQRDDNIVLDIMKCLTTVIGGDVQIQSTLIPLSGALLSPALRKHFVKATVEVCYHWIMMGLPLRTVKILLPPGTDIAKDEEVFAKVKAKLDMVSAAQMPTVVKYDVFFSYAKADAEAATQMMHHLKSSNPNISIYDGVPQEISVRERGVVPPYLEAIQQSRIFLSLLSDDYFHAVECTEAFSLAYCRDFDSQGNFIIPLFWRSCDLTPLARRLVATEGVDCREASFDAARVLLDELIAAINAQPRGEITADPVQASKALETEIPGGNNALNLADRLLMGKEDDAQDMFEGNEAPEGEEERVSEMFFDKAWKDQWQADFKKIVFGPRIGAGGFGEVYKAKFNGEMVAVKNLLKVEDDDPQAVIAEFMVEMKLMSKLNHPNVVTFIGACIYNPNLAIILEFMAGGSLYRAIHRRKRNNLGAFPLLKLLWIAYGISKGMEYLHAQYPVIIHRDLKSPNILLGGNVHEVKITDFGLSRLRVTTLVNTGPGGTPEWMAPELLRQDPFDEMSDVFSFGVIIWELVVCEKPWRDDHPMQIVFKVGSKGEKLSIPPGVQCVPELKNMITACFNDDFSKRPKFTDLSVALDQMIKKVESNRKN